MAKFAIPHKLKCPKCNELFDLDQVEGHFDDGQMLESNEWIFVTYCKFCRLYFEEKDLHEGFCNSCNAAAGIELSMEAHSLGQRLERNVNGVFLSNDGLRVIHDFMESWLEPFSPGDRGVLRWIFTSKMRPNVLGSFDEESYWYSPTAEELEFDRQLAFLPSSPADKTQLEVIRDWWWAHRNEIAEQYPDWVGEVEMGVRNPDVNLVTVIDKIWGIDGDQIRSLSELSNELNIDPFWVNDALRTSKNVVSKYGGGDAIRALNGRRDNTLWVAKFIDRFELTSEPDDELFNALGDAIESRSNLDSSIVLSFVQAEKSASEIAESKKLELQLVQRVLSEFRSEIQPQE
jgi:hypothetical protein